MENISIKLEKEWYCLQQDFEWKNIPPLAIITGVNGAGKTHLIRLFLNIGDTQPNVIHHSARVESSNDNQEFKLILPGLLSDKTLNGLIAYHNEKDVRFGTIAGLNQQLKNHCHSIEYTKNRMKNQTDVGEVSNFKMIINQTENTILNVNREILNQTIFPYEQEINSVALKVGKSIDEVTEEDLRNFANPIFNNLTSIEDLTSFIQQNESDKDFRRIKYSKLLNFDELTKIANEKKIHQRINELFVKFGFDYFELKDPYSDGNGWNGRLLFVGKQGETIDYSSLSSGEQMIVQFLIWAMGKDQRGNRINTMVLDEPDAHLHPKMCKMMIEILEEISKPKEDGGSDIRVIITTHSPSTVAFAPEGSLFVMEKDSVGRRAIKQSITKDAIHILSEGIFTFDKAIDSFQLITNSTKRLIVCTEGKTDVIHVKTAMEKLNRQLDVEVVDLHDAGTLSNFIKSTPASLFGGKKIIAVFDNDPEGQKAYSSIKGDEVNGYKKITAAQCDQKSFTSLLPLTDPVLEKYCPIEFLYPKEILDGNAVLEKRNYQEYMSLFKGTSPEIDQVTISEFSDESSLRPFKVRDNVKNQFAEAAKGFGADAFINFNPLLDIFEMILEEGD